MEMKEYDTKSKSTWLVVLWQHLNSGLSLKLELHSFAPTINWMERLFTCAEYMNMKKEKMSVNGFMCCKLNTTDIKRTELHCRNVFKPDRRGYSFIHVNKMLAGLKVLFRVTCTLLEFSHFLLLYTSTSLQLKKCKSYTPQELCFTAFPLEWTFVSANNNALRTL